MIEKTQRVSKYFCPDLLEMFRTVMRKLKPKYHITLRVGEIEDYARATPETEEGPCTVIISGYAADVLNREELLFLIGHEIAHLSMFTGVSDVIDRIMERLMPDIIGLPPEIANTILNVYYEMGADMFGVSVVEDVDVAVSASNKLLYGQFPAKNIEQANDISSLTDHAELIMQIKILRQLEKSELFYKVIGRPLFRHGQNLSSEDVFYRNVEDIFKYCLKDTRTFSGEYRLFHVMNKAG